MALHRDSRRRCKVEGLLPATLTLKTQGVNFISRTALERRKIVAGQEKRRETRSTTTGHDLNCGAPFSNSNGRPFPFFQLPREIRDEVYSHLVICQDKRMHPVLDATAILKNRKKRLAAQIVRDRLNRQRLLSGKLPTTSRTVVAKPALHLNLLRASQRLFYEATECLYSNNWYALSLNKLPTTVFEIPYGWDLARVKRLQVEIQIKDAVRMDRYIDWASFFSSFPALRSLRIVPSFHPRYYEWARTELCDWQTTHYVHKAFFRELLASIPRHVDLKIGSRMDAEEGIELQGRAAVDERLLWYMFAELGTRLNHVERYPAVAKAGEGGLSWQ